MLTRLVYLNIRIEKAIANFLGVDQRIVSAVGSLLAFLLITWLIFG